MLAQSGGNWFRCWCSSLVAVCKQPCYRNSVEPSGIYESMQFQGIKQLYHRSLWKMCAELSLLKSFQYCTEIERCHCVCTDALWRAWWCHTNSLSLGRVQRRLGWDYLFRIPSQHIYMPRRDTTDIRPLEELCEVQKCTNWSSLLFHIPFVTSCCMDLFLCLGVQGYNHRWYLLRFLQQNQKELKRALGCIWEILSTLILQAEVSERSWSFISLVCIMNFIKSKSWKCSSKKKKKKMEKLEGRRPARQIKARAGNFVYQFPAYFWI